MHRKETLLYTIFPDESSQLKTKNLTNTYSVPTICQALCCFLEISSKQKQLDPVSIFTELTVSWKDVVCA